MKLAYIFSGQGSQYEGMGLDLVKNYPCAKEVYLMAEAFSDYPIQEISFSDGLRLNQTKYTQVCMFTMQAAILAILKKNHIHASYSMGLSLGEYGAYLHQGVFDFKTGIEIVKKRAIFMEEAVCEKPGKMAAIIGMDENTLEGIIKKENNYVTIANYNTPKQLVISGEEEAVVSVSEIIKSTFKKRAIPLNTFGAFHSKLMLKAKDGFQSFLKSKKVNQPNHNLYLNTTGSLYKSNIKEHMANQITESVRFYQMVEAMVSQGVDTFIEIGPKKTLSGLVKKINGSLKVMNIEDKESLKKVLEYLEESHG
jgi:[acyl-carrier-protein] S-malonyltransferase